MTKNEKEQYTEEDYLNRIKYIEDIIEHIASIRIEEKNENDKYYTIRYKTILLLCLLDSYASYNIYSNETEIGKRFTAFVKEFNIENNFWEEIDIVQALYDKYMDKSTKSVDKQHLKEIIKETKQIIDQVAYNKVSDIILTNSYKKVKKEINPEIQKRYTFVYQLYQFRCRLIHKFSFPDYVQDMSHVWNTDYAYYAYSLDDKTDFLGVYLLVFPYAFIKNVVSSSIINYLNKCKEEKRNPFENEEDHITWKRKIKYVNN